MPGFTSQCCVIAALFATSDALRKRRSTHVKKANQSSSELQAKNASVTYNTDYNCNGQGGEECGRWDYGAAKCESLHWCNYRYKFGDIHLGQSCRCRRQYGAPTEYDCDGNGNQDCKNWDYGGAKCSSLNKCEYRYRFGDTLLDQSCRCKAECLGSNFQNCDDSPPPPTPAPTPAPTLAPTPALPPSPLPAARAQFSQKALDYFAHDLLPVLVEEEIPKAVIPDVSGSASGFAFSIHNIRITNPRIDRPVFRIAPGQGIDMELNDVSLNLALGFHIDGEDWWNPVNERGEASCIPRVWASGIVVLGTSDGKPTLQLVQPSVFISMGDITISGSALGWLVEVIFPSIRGEIERQLELEVVKLMGDLVNQDLQGILNQLELKVPVPVPPPFDDSSLHFNLNSIHAHAEHITVDLSMALVDTADPNRLVTQPVRVPLPDIYDTSKMFSVTLAPEIIEDVVRFHQGKFSQIISADMVPEDSPLGLTTNSMSLLTTPALNILWGSRDMQLTLTLPDPVRINFGEGVVDLTLPSDFKFDVIDSADPEHAFTLAAPVAFNTSVRIDADPQAIHAELTDFSITPLTTKATSNGIWWVNTLVINPLIDILERQVIMPEINKLLEGGVACCEADGFALRGLDARLTTGALSVFSDVELDLRAILG